MLEERQRDSFKEKMLSLCTPRRAVTWGAGVRWSGGPWYGGAREREREKGSVVKAWWGRCEEERESKK